MGQFDHIGDPIEELITCKSCKKKFRVWEEEQVPGFRDKDYLYCPYCGAELGSSMSVEFHVSKIQNE